MTFKTENLGNRFEKLAKSNGVSVGPSLVTTTHNFAAKMVLLKNSCLRIYLLNNQSKTARSQKIKLLEISRLCAAFLIRPADKLC